MVSAPTVLVVVPDAELRRSIEFAFEAEGFAIEPHDGLEEALAASERAGVVCIVVDENAIDPRSGPARSLERAGKPLILLVDKLRAPPPAEGVRVLTKPLLGRLLVDTLASLTGGRRGARAT